jgi:hypothetical protein
MLLLSTCAETQKHTVAPNHLSVCFLSEVMYLESNKQLCMYAMYTQAGETFCDKQFSD